MAKDFWLFKDRITLSVGWYPQWDMSRMSPATIHYNGWRPGDRCLDITLRIWRLNLNATFWQMPFAKQRDFWDGE